MGGHKFSKINDIVNTKDIDNKIPIYQLKSKEKVLNYYDNWTKKEQFNKDMVIWNYEAPQNTASLLNKHAIDKKINILEARENKPSDTNNKEWLKEYWEWKKQHGKKT